VICSHSWLDLVVRKPESVRPSGGCRVVLRVPRQTPTTARLEPVRAVYAIDRDVSSAPVLGSRTPAPSSTKRQVSTRSRSHCLTSQPQASLDRPGRRLAPLLRRRTQRNTATQDPPREIGDDIAATASRSGRQRDCLPGHPEIWTLISREAAAFTLRGLIRHAGR